MRPDMSKVIVERPRVGIKTTRKGRKIDPDLQLSQEGMRAPHIRNFGGKQLNENLAPLSRFLNSRVGRNWDDVYSEICENIRSTSAVQHHVLEHVKTMVNICVTVNEDGSVISRGRYFQTIPYGWLFYVDSRTNILMRNHNYSTPSARNREYKNKREIERNSRERIMPDGTEVRKINGVWYEVEMQPVPAIERVAYVPSRKARRL